MPTFGTDPEFMVTKDGQPVSAIGIVPGDLANKVSVSGHEFYADNVLAECAVKPGSTAPEIIGNIRECLGIYADMVKPYRLEARASAHFPDDQMLDPAARIAGCAPDTCIYKHQKKKPPAKIIKDTNFRSCGGHIHIGDELIKAGGVEAMQFVYLLDLFVGVPSIFLDNDPTSIARRSLYGQAGRYRRKKEYGLEYRSVSNFWLRSPALVRLMYNLCDFTLDMVKSGKADGYWSFDIDKFVETGKHAGAWECLQYKPSQIQKAINTGDKKLAQPLFEIAKGAMSKGLCQEIAKLVESPPPDDLYVNWNL